MKRNWVLSKSGKEGGLGWWNLESKRWQLTLLSNPKGTIKRWLMLRHVTMFTLAWNALDLGTYWIEIFDKTSRYFMKFRNSKFDDISAVRMADWYEFISMKSHLLQKSFSPFEFQFYSFLSSSPNQLPTTRPTPHFCSKFILNLQFEKSFFSPSFLSSSLNQLLTTKSSPPFLFKFFKRIQTSIKVALIYCTTLTKNLP